MMQFSVNEMKQLELWGKQEDAFSLLKMANKSILIKSIFNTYLKYTHHIAMDVSGFLNGKLNRTV